MSRGLVGVGVVFLLAGASSGWFRWFDTALAGYFFGVVFAVFATVYRYSVWLQRPPTAKPEHLGVLLLAVALLAAQGLVINRLAGLPYPLWSPKEA